MDDATPLLAESTPLFVDDAPLGAERKRTSFAVRYRSAHKCVGSKSALLILVCSFTVGLWTAIFLNPDVYLTSFTTIYTLAGYGFVAFVLCFFPLAGCLADTYGRHDMVVMSMLLMLISVPLLIVILPLGLIDTYVGLAGSLLI